MQFSASMIMAAATILSCANAHMLLNTPTPFGGYSNGPVEADGSNFPCKNPNYSDRSGETSMSIGSSQKLSFKGTAVHGGGSCQVSLTSDLAPNKQSKWLVIHSIEGGCPGQDPNAPNQNLGVPANPENVDPNSGLHEYNFKIPEGIAPGQYVLAWSWVNKIGNREYYMNCAPIKVTGGSAKRSPADRRRRAELEKRADFPEMFTANIGNGCSTTEGVDTLYPNPGQSVEKGTLNMNFGPPVGNCGSGSVSPAPAPAPGPAPAPAPYPNPTGGVFHEPTPSAIATPAPAPAAPAPAPAAPAPAAPAPADPPASGNGTASPTTGGTGALTGACTTEGLWNCIGGNSFQRCASGRWSVVMALAAKTSCKPGQSNDFSLIVKRDAKFNPGHLAMHRRHS